MNLCKSINKKLYFIKPFLFVGLNVLFFFLLFSQIQYTYNNIKVNYHLNILDKVTRIEAVKIQKNIKRALTENNLSDFLYRYSVFFYTDDYENRNLFLNSTNLYNVTKIVDINEGSFYQEMLNAHLQELCFIKNTQGLDKNSSIYKSLAEKYDIAVNKFYVSCPIYIEQNLIGYLGGIYIQKDGGSEASQINLLPIKKSVEDIKNILIDF